LSRTTILIVLLCACAGLAACGEGDPVVKVDMDKRAKVTTAAPDEAYTYAYLPQYSHTISYQRHRDLLEYLRQATGLPLRQIFPDTFDEHIKMVERGEIDISFSNPFIYVQLAKAGARAFARVVEPSGRPNYRGQVICRADNPLIKTLGDCRGKRWIAVDPGSAGGYLFPRGLFLDAGIRPEDFAEVAFAPGPGGKQEKVILGVYSGAYDVGTIREGALNVMGARIDLDTIRILAQTRDYPGWVYAARPGLDQAVVERIAEAMFTLGMDDPGQAKILSAAGIRGIIPTGDEDYDPIRELAVKLERRAGSGTPP